jgi:hypothetical protein
VALQGLKGLLFQTYMQQSSAGCGMPSSQVSDVAMTALLNDCNLIGTWHRTAGKHVITMSDIQTCPHLAVYTFVQPLFQSFLFTCSAVCLSWQRNRCPREATPAPKSLSRLCSTKILQTQQLHMKFDMVIFVLVGLCVAQAFTPDHQRQKELQVWNCHAHHLDGEARAVRKFQTHQAHMHPTYSGLEGLSVLQTRR